MDIIQSVIANMTIIRDGVNPEDIHRELLRVSEYYDMCANDMPGITARDSIFSVGKS